MCCTTHEERDRLELAAAEVAGQDVSWKFAEDERFRCQCKFNVACKRRATQEDFLCDWCREKDHHKECMEMGASGYLGSWVERESMPNPYGGYYQAEYGYTSPREYLRVPEMDDADFDLAEEFAQTIREGIAKYFEQEKGFYLNEEGWDTGSPDV